MANLPHFLPLRVDFIASVYEIPAMETSTEQPFTREGRAGQQSNSHAFRAPSAADAVRVHDLVARCPPLDANSLYCNLLQCSHFSETCVLAERNGALHGWVSGYVRPDRPDFLFVWQVAVAPEARGSGLGRAMIGEILQREACRRIARIETTITGGNNASWGLFERLASELGATATRRPGFDSKHHFADRNPTEHLVDIGPIRRGAIAR